jgi:murein DD-endopeptidase MepM/ murein hydrolase activator NlpD
MTLLIIFGFMLAFIGIGFMLPGRIVIPVQGADPRDWNHATFWYEPWGLSGVHKGIDIFARKGTPLLSATPGIVIYNGELPLGGKVLAVLGPQWRIHYYAHLESTDAAVGEYVAASEIIGTVGDSGNARGKPAHLHYSVITLFPYFWRWDDSTQGWKKMFFLNPSEMLLQNA